jgi:hypothetical protein
MLLLNGVVYVAIGLALIAAPEWFFTSIGAFPPFNRHYEGDLGSFLLPLGAGFLYAARNPAQNVGLLGVAAAGGLLHALNHVYDALRGTGTWDQTLALLVFAILTLAALVQVVRDNRSSSTAESPRAMAADPGVAYPGLPRKEGL